MAKSLFTWTDEHGVQWFVDWRLRELRQVNYPHNTRPTSELSKEELEDIEDQCIAAEHDAWEHKMGLDVID